MKITGSLTIVVFTLQQVIATQRKSNCLQHNPGILHGEFNWYNKQNLPWNVTEQEVTTMINLFSTRFQNAYSLNGISNENLEFVLPSFAKFARSNPNGPFVKLYLTNHPGGKTKMELNETIRLVQEFKEMVLTTNRIQPGTIAGIALRTKLTTYGQDNEVFEKVFGSNDSANIEIGYRVTEAEFKNDHKIFQKISYIIITMKINFVMDPRTLADAIVRRCDAYQEDGKMRNIRANVLCTVNYPSGGVSSDGIAGSLDKFSIFWCRIIENLVNGKKHANIIMDSAFDDSLAAFPDSSTFNPYSIDYFYGWWSRTSDVLLNESAYVEKIELLETNVDNGTVTGTPSDNNTCSNTGYQIAMILLISIIVPMAGFLIRAYLVNRRFYDGRTSLTDDI